MPKGDLLVEIDGKSVAGKLFDPQQPNPKPLMFNPQQPNPKPLMFYPQQLTPKP